MESQPASIDFQALPKIELHAHLSGSISRECLHDVWLDMKSLGETELRDPLEEMPIGKFDYDLETFFPLFSRYIYALCSNLPALILTTNRVLSDFQADGVVYLELRTTPRAIPSASITKGKFSIFQSLLPPLPLQGAPPPCLVPLINYSQTQDTVDYCLQTLTNSQLLLDEYVNTILTCIHSFNTNPTSTLKTNLILSIDRRNDVSTALEVVDLALKYRDQGVVGIDLCGDPSVGDVSIFAPAFQRAREEGLNITIHFAEAPYSSRPVELWQLLEFKPDRIGHVINVPDDVKQEIAKRKLGLELCLSCNVHAKMITGTYSDHHFGYWHDTSCPIALSTDDVGVFGSSLSNEYRLIAEHFNLSRKQIVELARGAIDVIFGGEEEKEKLRRIMWK